MDPLEKPPLGVMPKWRWLELRGCALAGAIYRYLDRGNIPSAKSRYLLVKGWISELKEIAEELGKKE